MPTTSVSTGDVVQLAEETRLRQLNLQILHVHSWGKERGKGGGREGRRERRGGRGHRMLYQEELGCHDQMLLTRTLKSTAFISLLALAFEGSLGIEAIGVEAACVGIHSTFIYV